MKKTKVDKRKILLFLPVVFLVLGALAFYLLKQDSEASGQSELAARGINASLPDAQFKAEKPGDKMSIYQMSQPDSAPIDDLSSVTGRLGFGAREEEQTLQINEKLAAINRELNSPGVPLKSSANSFENRNYSTAEAPLGKDVAKLEKLMKHMQSPDEEDPELQQLQSLMDKIIAVQHPEAVKAAEHVGSSERPDSLFRAIPAVIASDQKVVQGSVIELRLLDTVQINGHLIPKSHALFGLAEFSNQRMNVQIRNIRLGTSVIPVNLTVFDQRDAMPGINAPEALLTEAIASGSSGAVSGIGISGFDLGSQIAGAGLDAAKSLFNKRVKRVKQKLKAGYPLLLRDNQKRLK